MNIDAIEEGTLQTDPAVTIPSIVKIGHPISKSIQLPTNSDIDLKGMSRLEPNRDIHPIIEAPDLSQLVFLGSVVL